MWTTAKYVSLAVIFGLSSLSGITSCLAVVCLKRKYGITERFKRVISLLNCFSGGVFFATSILHLLTEAREKMTEALDLWGLKTEYPLTEVLTGVGFLLILSFENISHLCCSGSQLHETFKTVQSYAYGNQRYKSKPKIVYKRLPSGQHDASDDEEAHITESEDETITGTYQEYITQSGTHTEIDKGTDDLDKTVSYTSESATRKGEFNEHDILFKPNGKIANGMKKSEEYNEVDKRVPCSLTQSSTMDPQRSKIRGIILLVALSFHMIFDGLALGLLDEDKKVWTLLLALCVHKFLVFLSIGLEIFELLKSFRKSLILLLCFASISPVGVIIGVSVTASEDELAQSAASAILQSIATGTFLYVTFFEILHREFEDNAPDLLKVVCTVVGFALVGAVKLLEGLDF